MSKEIEEQIEKIPVLNKLMALCKTMKVPGLEGVSLYEILELYGIGIAKGAFSYRAAAIAFSFFMALFPFALFILNLIPYIPLEGFQEDFLQFVSDSVPPNTFGAVETILSDIMNNSYKSLLSFGFLMSIFLMANGLNAVLGGFESSYHVTIKRGYFRQYAVSIGLSLIFSFLLIVTISSIVVSEVFIQKFSARFQLDDVLIIEWARYLFILTLIFVGTSVLFKFGTRETKQIPYINAGAMLTVVLIIVTSYVFGIYVTKFARYNELYGSIGTLLVLMFYIWINCMILLLGFELNAIINKHKRKHDKRKSSLE
ncbi:YihY/virulence factor BrkB family protein [Flavobacterium pedocola]